MSFRFSPYRRRWPGRCWIWRGERAAAFAFTGKRAGARQRIWTWAGAEGDAAKLAKAFKQAAISAYGVAGPEFVRRLIDEQVTGDDVRGSVCDFVSAHVPPGADGQVDRAGQRFGLIAAAGELATLLG